MTKKEYYKRNPNTNQEFVLKNESLGYLGKPRRLYHCEEELIDFLREKRAQYLKEEIERIKQFVRGEHLL